MSDRVAISVVVPLFNEAPNVPPLVRAVQDALSGRDWELLLIDDGSTDGTGELADEIASSEPRVRVLHLARNFGQTAAMEAGFDHAHGRVVVSMDGDLQNDPRDIPLLVEELNRGFDLVTGYRENRKDKAISRRFPSWVANELARRITGVRIRDTGCSLRAYRSEVLHSMVLYSDMHRFIPAIAASTSGAKIAEIPVRHHARQFGSSKYGLSRTWRVLLDLLTIAMIRSFRDRPLRLFGLAAIAVAQCGLLFLVASAITEATSFVSENAVVFPAAAVILFGLATYIFMLGLVAEVFVRQYWRPRAFVPVVHEVSW
ncbi:MAG: glycosyltransferase family 2 protein [Gemmatimonadota bacterium]